MPSFFNKILRKDGTIIFQSDWRYLFCIFLKSFYFFLQSEFLFRAGLRLAPWNLLDFAKLSENLRMLSCRKTYGLDSSRFLWYFYLYRNEIIYRRVTLFIHTVRP